MENFNVSKNTPVDNLAHLIANTIRDDDKLELVSIGPGATNQVIKAIAVSRKYLVPIGVDITCAPSFKNVELEEKQRTAIKILVEKQK